MSNSNLASLLFCSFSFVLWIISVAPSPSSLVFLHHLSSWCALRNFFTSLFTVSDLVVPTKNWARPDGQFFPKQESEDASYSFILWRSHYQTALSLEYPKMPGRHPLLHFLFRYLGKRDTSPLHSSHHHTYNPKMEVSLILVSCSVYITGRYLCELSVV